LLIPFSYWTSSAAVLKLERKEDIMKICISDVVGVVTIIEGAVYLEIEDKEHLEEVVLHLKECWNLEVGE
jgi:hypothetical protein